MPHASAHSHLVLYVSKTTHFYTSFELYPRGARIPDTNRATCAVASITCSQSDGRRLLRHAAHTTIDDSSLGRTHEWNRRIIGFGGRYSMSRYSWDDDSDLSSDDARQNPVQWKSGREWWNGDGVPNDCAKSRTARVKSRVARSDVFYMRGSPCKQRIIAPDTYPVSVVALKALQTARNTLVADNMLRNRLMRIGVSAACGTGWLL